MENYKKPMKNYEKLMKIDDFGAPGGQVQISLKFY